MFRSVGAVKSMVATYHAHNFSNANVACLAVCTVCLELAQPVSAKWLAAELGPGA